MQVEKSNATDKNDALLSRQPINKHPETADGMLAVGTGVTINKSTLSGEITGYHLSADGTTLSYLVNYEDEGEGHQRAFSSNQISKKQ